jgi:hypothetical protein
MVGSARIHLAECTAMSLRHNLALRMARTDELPELIARTAAGDEGALAELYDRTSSLVHGLALKILGEPQSLRSETGCLLPIVEARP